jgi:copper transport protein
MSREYTKGYLHHIRLTVAPLLYFGRHGTKDSQLAERSPIMALIFRGLIVSFLIALLPCAFPDDAMGHARLVSSEPSAGSALPAMPEAFVLEFSEPVDPRFSRVDLYAHEGSLVAELKVESSLDDRRLEAPLPSDAGIDPGSYLLVWRVLSKVDGHSTTGSVAFSVGTGEAPRTGTGAGWQWPPLLAVIARWFELSAWLLLGGMVVFRLVHGRILAETIDDRSLQWLNDRLRLVMVSACFLGLVGLGLGVTERLISIQGEAASRLSIVSDAIAFLLDSETGHHWLLRLFLFVLLAVALLRGGTRLGPVRLTLALGAIMAGIVAVADSGHAAAEAQRRSAVAVDSLHFTAAAIWIGGLAALSLLLWLARSMSSAEVLQPVMRSISRHSALSLAVVGIMLVTGLTNASYHVSGPTTLRTEEYGVTLLTKVFLVLCLTVAAGVNLLVLVPRLRLLASSDNWPEVSKVFGGLGVVVGIELGIGVAVVLATSLMSTLPPADGPLPVMVASRQVVIEQQLTVNDVVADLSAELTGDPDDFYAVTLRSVSGEPLEDLQRFIVAAAYVEPASADLEIGDRFDATADPNDPGRYTFPAQRLGLAGEWELRLLVRRAGIDDVAIDLEIDTSETAPAVTRLVNDSWNLPRLSAVSVVFLVLGIAMMAIGVVGVRSLTGLEPVASAVLLTVSLMIATGFLISSWREQIPVTPETDLVNPIVASDASIARGEQLFLSNCQTCHGVEGAGVEEVDPRHLHGNEANLIDDRSSAQRDGDLFHWISFGVPGSEMPAYDAALTEVERWDLVNFLRWLQDGSREPEPFPTWRAAGSRIPAARRSAIPDGN